MEYPHVKNEYVETYESIFRAIDAGNKFIDDDVLSCYDTFGLYECLSLTNDEALDSNFLEGEIAKNELLAGTYEEPIEGLADVADSFPDICENDLLEIIKDERSIPKLEKIDETTGEENDMDLKTAKLNALARIFSFKTKPRNVRRSRPTIYDDLKSLSEVGDVLLSLSDVRDEGSMLVKKPRGYSDESLNLMLNEDDHSDGTKPQKGKMGRYKKHKVWSVPEVQKLVKGVSECGVGRWAEMKKLFFEKSPHRSPVDLKDKWRNLLALSCKPACVNGRGGQVRGKASATIPHHILRRVRELSEIHAYPIPRNQQEKMKEFITESSSSSISD